eukprot:SAG22_NODE_1977_length_3213_cov_0.999679_2_plen_272_part_00
MNLGRTFVGADATHSFACRRSILHVRVPQSTQMARIRRALRGSEADPNPTAVVYKGTNALIRRTLASLPEGEPIRALLPYITGDIVLVFTNNNPCAVLDVLDQFEQPARWQADEIAETTIILPAGPTGLAPDQTAGFSALNTPTKINRGQIEITQDVEVGQEGDKVGATAAFLANRIGVFKTVKSVIPVRLYQGGDTCKIKYGKYHEFPVRFFEGRGTCVLRDDARDNAIIEEFRMGVRHVAALCAGADCPTVVVVPHVPTPCNKSAHLQP